MAEAATPPRAAGLATRLAGLLARYDGTLMRPPALPGSAPHGGRGDGAALPDATRHAPGPALLDWCHAPAPGLRSARLQGQGARALAEALALHLDGSLRLQACHGTAARLALRLGVKLDDLALALGRAPRRSDCWDAGWLIDPATALARLPQWQPRRPTLLLATAPGDAPANTMPPPPLPAAGGTPALRLLWVHEQPLPLLWQALDTAG
ncbi:hypothetical protein AACH10_23560 [Ideonella sp. DXS22W]|uniref:Type III secretion protein n=1 Tax=Pseudaquabacterium inlustre TaxID=2984192 RepID=A0ABU9CNR0_9BURK